jgi:hypothetical protein
VINQVGTILQHYNTNKKINLFGFGGSIDPFPKQPAHCFAMNGNIFDPRVDGIQQVMQHYKHCIDNNNVNLFGPTHFSSILNTVNSMCESDPGNYNN